MKRKLLFAVFYIFFALLRTYASSVSITNAQQAALNFYKITFPSQPGRGAQAILKYTQTEADNTNDFYVFNIVPLNGFVIVSADNAVIPVIAYSNESYFDTAFQNTGVADWVKKSAIQIHQTVLQQIPADSRINKLWQAYLAGNNPGAEKSNSVGPLLQTTWNQLPYYNELCPVNYLDGQLCVTGCVATAMAQIMKYWNYPPQGTGSFSYFDGGGNYSLDIGTLSANFGATAYQWTQMPDYLYQNDSAVAILMSQCGISVAMDYSDEGSGAVVTQVEADLYYGYQGAPCAQYSYPNYFLYNPNTIQAVFQSDYSAPEWITLIEGEMNAGRVVQYQGSEQNVGGHTWVCDGYDNNNNFHMNWGWGGIDNGFFALTNLSAGGYTFNEDDAALIGIEPLNSGPNNDTACSLAASFTYQNTGGSNIQFSNTSTSNQSFLSKWTFYNSHGQFATSTIANPQITFTGSAPYSAQLVVYDSAMNGCRDTITQSVNFNPNTTCVTFQRGNTHATGALICDFTNTNWNQGYDFANTETGDMPAEQWTGDGIPEEARSLLRYDLSQIPAGSVIISAKLNLYTDTIDHQAGAPSEPTYGTNNACYLHQIITPWDPATVSWDTQPVISNTNVVLLPQSTNTNEDYLNVDVSGFVQYWINNPDSNYGMLLKMITQNYYNAMVFCSPGYIDTTKWPELEICYVAPNPCHAQASFVQQNLGGGAVQFTNTSTDNGPYSINWIFYDSTGQFTTSMDTNPLITFTGQPPYSATLIITDSICSDTLSQLASLNNCIAFQHGSAKAIGAVLSSYFPDTNYNYATGYPEFFAEQWTIGGIPDEVRGLLKYDLSQIAPGSVIVSAKLNLYTDTINDQARAPGQPTYGSNDACYLHRVTSPWDPATVTWNTQPTASNMAEVLLPQSTNTNEDYLNIDVSSFVQAWVNNPDSNFGMLLRLIAQNYYNAMVFCSSAHQDSTKWPSLEICYQLASPCKLLASFTQQNLGANKVQFTNTSTTNANTIVKWTFYNGAGVFDTSTQPDPVITFTGSWPYSATIQIADTGTGCTDTLQQPADISGCITLQQGNTKATGANMGTYAPDNNHNFATGYKEIFAEQWTINGTPDETRGLLKYDLSQIPQGSVIASAKLNLYTDTINDQAGAPSQPTEGSNNACYLRRVINPWNAATVTWNNQPTASNTAEVLLAQSTSTNEDYLNIDVSSFVQNWVNNPDSNYGMLLEIITQNYYNAMVFCSSAHQDTTKWPSLEICYDAPTTTGIVEPVIKETNLFIYPNPNNGKSFYVQLPSGYNLQSTQIKVFDMLGKEIMPPIIERQADHLKLSLNEGSAAGIYTLIVSDYQNQQCGKLVVVK